MNASTLRILYAICAIAFVVIIARAWLNVKGTDALVASLPQPQVQAFARQQLDALQMPSFEGDLELCGIIYETRDGELGVSRPRSGDEASCDLQYFDEPGMVPVASFHTHGSHSDQYDGEVPSTVDIESDIASGLDGYIATPGGRLWHIDHREGIAVLACGPACLTQDPDYTPCSGDPVANRYTLEELRRRFSTQRPVC
ncbi:MAG: DUF4329 domain-containing protein [Erythrobacter sp.]